MPPVPWCPHAPPSCFLKMFEPLISGLEILRPPAKGRETPMVSVETWSTNRWQWSNSTTIANQSGVFATKSIWLVVWTPLKNISQSGWLFPIYGKIKFMATKPPTRYTSQTPQWNGETHWFNMNHLPRSVRMFFLLKAGSVNLDTAGNPSDFAPDENVDSRNSVAFLGASKMTT